MDMDLEEIIRRLHLGNGRNNVNEQIQNRAAAAGINRRENQENVGIGNVQNVNRQTENQNVNVNRGNPAPQIPQIRGNQNMNEPNQERNHFNRRDENLNENRRGRNANRGGNHNPNRGNNHNRGNHNANNNQRRNNDQNQQGRGNNQNWRPNRGNNRGGRGNHGFRARGRERNVNSRPQTPQMDWFNMEEDRGVNRAMSVDNVFMGNNIPFRNEYGGRYQSVQDDANIAGPSRQQRPRWVRDIGFKKLEEIKGLESDQIICTLEKEENGFDKMVKDKFTPDKTVLFMHVIKKVCESVFTQSIIKILTTVCNDEFLTQLKQFIQDINLQDHHDKYRNKYLWNDTNLFWESVLAFFEALIKFLPNLACDILPKLIKVSVTTIRDFTENVSEDIKKRLEEAQMKLMLCQEEREKKKVDEINEEAFDTEPPDDFRQISLYPSVQEITTDERKLNVFLRPILSHGRYKDVHGYLDIQFRLLREDFISPLRDGICKYLDQYGSKKKEKNHDVYIYQKVRFIKSQTVNSKIVRMVQFNADKKRKFRLENTKRFMFGSLVCFTKDLFQTISLGTICEKKMEYLKQGLIGVELIRGTFSYDTDYIMVECSVYFEPYYQVLKALQHMEEEKFPLKKYIVDVDVHIQPPEYLNHNIIMTDKKRNLHIRTLYPTEYWPNAKQLGLDDSQYKAFHSALTKEFCVIQGPPGTGKTYIGLRIAEILLQNSHYWHSGPILVICFTNHALDQFLEGIIQFTDDVVRIGGQSKNEKLSQFNIKEVRHKRTKLTNEALFKLGKTLHIALSEMTYAQKMIDVIVSNENIINISVFEDIDKNLVNSWFSRATKTEILEWLLGGHNAETRYEERRKFRMAEAQRAKTNVDADAKESDEEDSASEADSEEFFDAENLDQERVVDDEQVNVEINTVSVNKLVLTSKFNLEQTVGTKERDLRILEVTLQNEPNNDKLYDPREKAYDEYEKAKLEKNYVEYRLDQRNSGMHPRAPDVINYKDPTLLTPNERWGLYWKWLQDYQASLSKKLTELEKQYRGIYRRYEELRSMEDIRLMKSKMVVGMTTSGAARYQTVLQALQCPIVIVEEAAEVLESHVVVSLTDACQHLILIGDHKQLRPTTSVYRLATKFNLEISLFERMVKNDIHCSTLEVQHRMRPEIAKLIVPSIYSKLENHSSVNAYSPVQGTTSSLFFITHTENEESEGDTTSKKNVHEAKFLIRLARHLLLQGYEPSEITILATYTGQMFLLFKERREIPSLKDVRITVVDNFQGEENKIILLSLVRSNPEGNIGFLKTDNRVCVALSRAKEGLFIMGNMDILVKNNNIWPQIKATLEEQNAIRPYLTLQCQNHPDQYTKVREASDFLKVSEGGCTLLCGRVLICGHSCKSLCHITDREHTQYKCKEPCPKILCIMGHQCPDYCFKDCKPCMVRVSRTLSCGHTHLRPCHENPKEFKCPTPVNVELECGHKADKPCFKDLASFPCPHPCEIRRPCGHKCDKKCHVNDDPDHLETKCYKPCGRYRENCSTETHYCPLRCHEPCLPCTIEIKKERRCGHMLEVPCKEDVNELICEKRCKKLLPCGHNCRQKCCDPCGNCKEMVEKTIVLCGHKLRTKCSEEPDRKKCNKFCPLKLPCGHKCQERCNKKCTEKCEQLIDCTITPACGHKFKIPCHKKNITDPNSYDLLKHCTEPCSAALACSHPCAGNCGNCAQGRIHYTCQQPCGTTLICGHSCGMPCREACKPCPKKCTYSCVHSRCGKKCGEPCTKCTEPCERRCPHVRCTKKCGEMCDVEPCGQPCQQLLRCGHSCIGFCGEPCPPVCRVCDPDNEIFQIFFGNEDEEDARFIYLEECKHCIESGAMDDWIKQTSDEITVKSCPRCKTIITKTLRYSNDIKKAYLLITKVKKEGFGNEVENNNMRLALMMKITELIKAGQSLLTSSKHLKNILQLITGELQLVKNARRQALGKQELQTYENKLEIISNIINIYNKCKNRAALEKCKDQADFLLEVLTKEYNRITKQEIDDYQMEICRYERFIQVCSIEGDSNFQYVQTTDEVKTYHSDIWKIISSAKKYTLDHDERLKKYIVILKDLVNKSMVITAEEKKMIVKAMGMAQGHWFKCPNGHIYCITECGGAMQKSKCNECGAAIGGSNHQLLRDNTHDRSMDGSSYAAWSDAANIANYVLD